ncbi:integrase catalytic domain-containing protein [Trichonephila clavipes]|nr:integrase catalytic domain-containing protein [Trichonephila clavipes]
MSSEPAPLSLDRVADCVAFEIVGIDLAEPLFLKSGESCASNDLSKLDWDKITRETITNKILWKFIPPSADWWVGWWERLVRIVKELLRRTLGKCTLTYEELNTILCDCESIINCRPLTYVSEDPGELIPLVTVEYNIYSSSKSKVCGVYLPDAGCCWFLKRVPERSVKNALFTLQGSRAMISPSTR